MKAIFFVLLLSGLKAAAQQPEIYQKDGAAIAGYDVVAFFTDAAAVKGSSTYTLVWNDAAWHFATAAHRDSFAVNPGRYAPQYGGWCAYGMAGGYKAPTQADTWTVLDGKLYFNYSRKVKSTWDKDRGNYILKADGNWPAIRREG